MHTEGHSIDYQRPIPLAPGVYWVGFYDTTLQLHCNPYLITDGDEAVLIDAGSRTDLTLVLMKILEIIEPRAISAIILQHYDPDLCSSVPVLEQMIGNPALQVISHHENNPFIRHYGITSPIVCFETMGSKFRFRSGRELHFHRTPFAHSSGSFVTYDPATEILFTSDLFGSYSTHWELFVSLDESCATCSAFGPCDLGVRCSCPLGHPYCPMPGILDFHRRLMPCGRALRYAMEQIRRINPAIAAPQHGSVLLSREDVATLIRRLSTLEGVGIDGFEVPE